MENKIKSIKGIKIKKSTKDGYIARVKVIGKNNKKGYGYFTISKCLECDEVFINPIDDLDNISVICDKCKENKSKNMANEFIDVLKALKDLKDIFSVKDDDDKEDTKDTSNKKVDKKVNTKEDVKADATLYTAEDVFDTRETKKNTHTKGFHMPSFNEKYNWLVKTKYKRLSRKSLFKTAEMLARKMSVKDMVAESGYKMNSVKTFLSVLSTMGIAIYVNGKYMINPAIDYYFD